jgi:FixJ family two-component response regulator
MNDREPTQKPENNIKCRTVYIVDDDNSSRRGLSSLLTVAGFQVESFASVEEFYKIQTFDNHSCLIVDAWVKDLSPEGLQAAVDNKFHDIPIIFLSARVDKTSMEKAIKANAAGFFHKPVDGPALIDTISWGIERIKARRGH